MEKYLRALEYRKCQATPAHLLATLRIPWAFSKEYESLMTIFMRREMFEEFLSIWKL